MSQTTRVGHESDNTRWPWVRQHELAMSQTTRGGHESDNTRWPWVRQHEVAMSQTTRVDGSWPLAGQGTGRYLHCPRFHLWLQQREGSVGHYVCMLQVISASNYIINALFYFIKTHSLLKHELNSLRKSNLTKITFTYISTNTTWQKSHLHTFQQTQLDKKHIYIHFNKQNAI